jgi:serine/threonine-protein phosphatase 6 regulatory ankyrin repeat subunit B
MSLIKAVREGDMLEVRRIIRDTRRFQGDKIVDLNQTDLFGNTALHWAVSQSEAEDASIVELLLDARARANVENEEGVTPVMRACRQGKVAAVLALLAQDANISNTDRDGGTCLMKAAFGGQTRILEMLMGDGGNAELMDKGKRTALHHAARQVLAILYPLPNGALTQPRVMFIVGPRRGLPLAG